MYNNWKVDLSDSSRALLSIRDTHLKNVIGGKIYSIESSDNDVLMLMDQKCGIDYIRENDNGLQGIAARVQFGKAYNTFTVRSRRHTGSITEFEKRRRDVDGGYFYPQFTMQAYFADRSSIVLLSIGVVRTSDLYSFIAEHGDMVHTRWSDNEFKFVKWADMINSGVRVITYAPAEAA